MPLTREEQPRECVTNFVSSCLGSRHIGCPAFFFIHRYSRYFLLGIKADEAECVFDLQPTNRTGGVGDIQDIAFRIDDKRGWLNDIAFFFVPAR